MKNMLIKGGSGTGKTITARAIAYYIGHEGQEIRDVYKNDFWLDLVAIENFAQSEFVEYIQVHPSMSYEDIVYGIEVKSNGGLTMAYAEKRIKQICDRANGRPETFFVILDDIGRANPGRLLGNLLYAMEYRNQAVVLADGNNLIVPDNVCFMITECQSLYGSQLEYALRRRFDYEKELHSSKDILDRYYNGILPNPIKTIVLDVYERVKNFINHHAFRDSSIQLENYYPGHGMLMVDRNGSAQDILLRIKGKIIYQLWPHVIELKMSGIISATDADMDSEYSYIMNQINVGQAATTQSATVQKIFVNSRTPVPNVSLVDSKNYFLNTIIPNGSGEYRTILECVADAIFLNGVLQPDKALSDVFLNTNAVKFANRNHPNAYAAFMVKDTEVNDYYYTKQSDGTTRQYFTKGRSRGRWQTFSDTPAYLINYANGNTATYIMVNALRNAGCDLAPNVTYVVATGNTASIYRVFYLLVQTYLQTYETELSLMVGSNPGLMDLYHLVGFEKQYWYLKHISAQTIRGGDAKLQALSTACLNLRTLWNSVGTVISLDQTKFNDLVTGASQISVINYEGLYNNITVAKSITVEGVNTMVDLNDYQQIMDSIGVRQMIFQGPPGTSKTFESKRFVLKQLNPSASSLTATNPSQEDISRDLEDYKLTAADYDDPANSPKLATGGWDLVQFHPSYGYEDFIRGIEVKPLNGNPVYESINRILGKIAEFAKIAENAAGQGTAPNFYLIIDEINRANLATVFGELIYGLEYRDSKVSTPYEVLDKVINAISKDIVLGKNLYIIGTMNTADKSIDSIDYAIRRRFIFIDSPAKRDVVKNCYQATMNVQDEDSIELLLFDAIGEIFDNNDFFNEEYQKNDVRIGHTYFLRSSSTDYVDEMAEKFVFQVIPILREYVKDGILDTYEELSNLEHSTQSIAAASIDDRATLLSQQIMMFVKYFGDKDSSSIEIDNQYIADYIEDLCAKLGY